MQPGPIAGAAAGDEAQISRDDDDDRQRGDAEHDAERSGAGRVGVALLMGILFRGLRRGGPCARAEHSAMTREARAIGLVR